MGNRDPCSCSSGGGGRQKHCPNIRAESWSVRRLIGTKILELHSGARRRMSTSTRRVTELPYSKVSAVSTSISDLHTNRVPQECPRDSGARLRGASCPRSPGPTLSLDRPHCHGSPLRHRWQARGNMPPQRRPRRLYQHCVCRMITFPRPSRQALAVQSLGTRSFYEPTPPLSAPLP